MSNHTDNTQADHIVDMHEMVADTNQASEDELMGELRLLYVRRISSNLSLAEYMLETRQLIQKLIRTEKLKLLAEVRERVVGEDLPLNTTPDTGQRIYNKVKANERTALTKLEAEL